MLKDDGNKYIMCIYMCHCVVFCDTDTHTYISSDILDNLNKCINKHQRSIYSFNEVSLCYIPK